MSRNKKPRNKAYRPRTKGSEGGLTAIAGRVVDRMAIPEWTARTLESPAWTALQAIIDGHGTGAEWNSLAGALNHSKGLAERGYGDNIIPEIDAAMDAMRRLNGRYNQHGKMGLDGEGLQALRLALGYWGDQLRSGITIGEADAVTRYVEREFQRAHAEGRVVMTTIGKPSSPGAYQT